MIINKWLPIKNIIIHYLIKAVRVFRFIVYLEFLRFFFIVLFFIGFTVFIFNNFNIRFRVELSVSNLCKVSFNVRHIIIMLFTVQIESIPFYNNIYFLLSFEYHNTVYSLSPLYWPRFNDITTELIERGWLFPLGITFVGILVP